MTDPISTDLVGGTPEHTRAVEIGTNALAIHRGLRGSTPFPNDRADALVVVDALAAAGALAGLPGPPATDELIVPRRFVVEAVLALEAATTIGKRSKTALHYANHDRLVAEGQTLAASWFDPLGAGLPGPTTPPASEWQWQNERYTDEQLQGAVASVKAYFPDVAEIVERIVGEADADHDEAWEARRSMRAFDTVVVEVEVSTVRALVADRGALAQARTDLETLRTAAQAMDDGWDRMMSDDDDQSAAEHGIAQLRAALASLPHPPDPKDA